MHIAPENRAWADGTFREVQNDEEDCTECAFYRKGENCPRHYFYQIPKKGHRCAHFTFPIP